MARFAFRLQRVLALREAQAKQAKVHAADAAAAVLDCELRLEQATAAVKSASQRLMDPVPAGMVMRGGDLMAAAAFLGAARSEVAGSAANLAEAEAIQAQAIALARQAWGDAEALSTLRARRHKVWETAELNTEQRSIDDITASGRHGRGTGQ